MQDFVKIGEDFELDLRACELRRAGRTVKLERIPLEVLRLLVEQRGQLVTREQIVERIWGKDAFLDTDNGINGAIRKIRFVLGDDPEDPRFIQTLTGRGYRFIAPVVEPEPGEADNKMPFPVASPEPAISNYEQPVESGANGRRRPHWGLFLGLAMILIAAMAAGFHWARAPVQRQTAKGKLMLAVLPFDNLTGDPGQDYFSDGLTEEMITQLGALDPQELGVIGRTSVMHYKDGQKPLDQIGRELGVQYVLEGSVRRDNKRIRITAKLIQVKDQSNLWAKDYDREIEDLLAIEGDIARQIAVETQMALGTGRPIQAAVPATLSPERYEAFDLYLKGLYFLNKRSVVGLRQAIVYFQQATEKDASYAPAYALLADSYALLGAYSGAPPADFASKARVAALRAVELDNTSSEAHTALALVVQNYDYNWHTSEKEFKRAIELNPNYATAHQWYAEHLMWQGRFDEALAESDRARQLDPLSLIIAADKGIILLDSRQYDRAIEQLTAVLEMDPGFGRARVVASAYLQKGMFEKVLSDIKSWPAQDSPWYFSGLAYYNGRAGRPREATRALEKLVELNRRQPSDPIVFVDAYIGTGNREAAITSLEKAYLQHSNGLTGLKVDPDYDVLRNDPRFKDLLGRVGLQ